MTKGRIKPDLINNDTGRCSTPLCEFKHNCRRHLQIAIDFSKERYITASTQVLGDHKNKEGYVVSCSNYLENESEKLLNDE